MKKTKAQEILEESGGTNRPVVRAEDFLRGLDEGLGGSIQTFMNALNRVPQTYRNQEVSLGGQICLWLWMRSRFDELEKKVERELTVITNEIKKLSADRDGEGRTS
jgi:hypothetical protein